MRPASPVARLALLGLAIASAFAAVALAGIGPTDVREAVAGAGVAGPLVFVLVGGALSLALFPGHVTAALAGLIFGPLYGVALALAAALVGASLCMFTARRLGEDAVGSLLRPRALRWRDWLAANGFGAVLASRLTPGVPSGPVNYLAGLVGIAAPAFLAAVALGALPKTIAYVTLGGALDDPISPQGALAVGLFAVTGIAGILLARRLSAGTPGDPQPAPSG